MRALVLGGAGMLGHRLWRELATRMDAYVALRRPFSDYEQVRAALGARGLP